MLQNLGSTDISLKFSVRVVPLLYSFHIDVKSPMSCHNFLKITRIAALYLHLYCVCVFVSQFKTHSAKLRKTTYLLRDHHKTLHFLAKPQQRIMQKPQNHSARARDFGLRITILARMLAFHIIQYVRHVECRLTIFFSPCEEFQVFFMDQFFNEFSFNFF